MFTIPIIYKDPSHFSDINKLFTQQPDYTSGLELCIAVVALTIIIASLTYRFIEVPARNYFNKVFETKAKKVSISSVQV